MHHKGIARHHAAITLANINRIATFYIDNLHRIQGINDFTTDGAGNIRIDGISILLWLIGVIALNVGIALAQLCFWSIINKGAAPDNLTSSGFNYSVAHPKARAKIIEACSVETTFPGA